MAEFTSHLHESICHIPQAPINSPRLTLNSPAEGEVNDLKSRIVYGIDETLNFIVLMAGELPDVHSVFRVVAVDLRRVVGGRYC